jgi:hypothetical protein
MSDKEWMDVLMGHADKLVDLRDEATELEAKQKDLNAQIMKLEQSTIPELMDLYGLKGITLDSGASLSVVEDLKCKIPASQTEEACSWLEANGDGGVIKRKFDIEFPKEETAWADKFERDLAQRIRPLNVKRTKGVHPQTLKALLKGYKSKGVPFTDDVNKMFGVFMQKKVQIT